MLSPQRPGPAEDASAAPDPSHPHPMAPIGGGPQGLDVPVAPVRRRRMPSGAPIALSLAVVALVAGAVLFVSGYTLGRQQGTTPGTGDSLQQAFEPFWDAYHKIDREYVGDVDQKALVEGAIGGMFEALGDPYSSYMTSEEYKNSLSGISGQFEGIGAEMTSRDDAGETGCSPAGDGCHLVVVRALPDSPAEKAGLEADDEVLAVDAQSVIGQTLDETVNKVRGKRGTPVTLTLSRDDAAPFDVRIVRDVIETEDVTSRVIGDGEVGYIQIQGFSSSAAGDFKDQLRELVEAQDIDKLVLDLRDDPGGFVDAARTIASQFVSSGPIFWEEYADGKKKQFTAEADGIATDLEIEVVVLVNGGTASASEIVAGALQDTDRGTVVGETTFGKGTIQQWQTLSNDTGGFRLSIAKWLTPDQTWIHEKGIEPDVSVTVPEDLAEGEDPVLDRAVGLLTDGTTAGD